MKRVLLFLVLVVGGGGALVLASGGLRGTRRDEPTPELTAAAPTASTPRAEPVPLPAIASSGARVGSRAAVQPLGAVDRAITAKRVWLDPLTKEEIPLPYFTLYSVHANELAPERRVGSEPASARWADVHITCYRNVETLSREEALALAADPSARRRLVLYEIDAQEGTASFAPEGASAQEKGPPVVIRLEKDVRIHVVPDDIRIRTSELTIDSRTGTVEGAADLLVEAPSFTAAGNGLRLEATPTTKRRSSHGWVPTRVEIQRQVSMDVRALSNGRAKADADFVAGSFRPRTLRTAGSLVVTRHESGGGRVTYEAVLSDRVRVEGDDGSELTAREVVLHLVPKETTPGKPRERPARSGARDPATAGDAWRLQALSAQGDVRVLRPEQKRNGPDAVVGKGGRSTGAVAIETERLTARLDDPANPVVTLEGATKLSYLGELALPGTTGRRGTVVATCRERVVYGPPVAGLDPVAADIAVELSGDVRIDASVPSAEGSERLEADRVRLLLKRVAVPALGGGSREAGSPSRETELEATAFFATGGDVSMAGPLVSGRGREIKAFDIDQRDSWRLVISGPDARVEVMPDEIAALERRDAAEKAGDKSRDDAKAASPASQPRREWVVERLDARGKVDGTHAPRRGDVPIEFSGDVLVHSAVDGGELRGAGGRDARLTYPGEKGRDQSFEAPLVAFRIADDVTTVRARGGFKGTFWTGRARPAAPKQPKARRSVGLEGGSVLELAAGLTPANESTVTIRARDGASIENRESGVTTDRLSATSITATLVGRAMSPRVATKKPSTAAKPASRAATNPAGATDVATRWTITGESVNVEVAGAPGAEGLDGVRSVVATGRVVASSEGAAGASQRLDGERFVLRADGDAHRGRLEGAPGARAMLSADDADLPQKLASPAIDFVLDGSTVTSATFSAPVQGAFHRRDKKSGAVEKIVLKSAAGPLTIDRDGRAVVEGSESTPVLVTRWTRKREAADFSDAITLSSPRLELTSSGPLGSKGAEIDRFVATGRGTLFQTAGGKDGTTRALGDRLVYDRVAHRVELSGADGVYIERPDFRGKARWFRYDTETGLADVEGPQVSLDVK